MDVVTPSVVGSGVELKTHETGNARSEMLCYLVVIIEEFIVMKLNSPLAKIWDESAKGKI